MDPRIPRTRRWLTALVVCGLLLTSAIGAGVATGQESEGLRFAEAVTADERGDVAQVPIHLGDRRRATLSVRAPDGTYAAQTQVVDADDDGRVTVEINTFRAGWSADPAATYAVGAGDRIERVVRRTDRLAGPLPEGRYNLVVAAGGESTSATLVLRAGSVDGATAATIPAGRLGANATSAVPETRRFETGTVATGDHAVVTVNVSGIGGVLASTAPPGANLVHPTDSMPDTSTTHTVRVGADRAVTPETITVRYAEGGAPQSLGRFDASRIRHLGVDTDGDGIIEADLASAITDVTADSDGITVNLDTETAVGTGETLLLAYRARNPTATGTYGVQASVEGTDAAVDTGGEVVYGVAGRGTLGYGIDLQFAADGDGRVVDPLAAVDYHYADDRLYAVVNTSRLETGHRYSVGLIRWSAGPLGNDTQAASAGVEITDRRATLVDPSPNDPFLVGGGETAFRAETTLAPTTAVVVEVSGSGANSFLFQQTTRVGGDRRLSATFDLPATSDRQPITVRIVEDGRVVGYDRLVVTDGRANN